MKYVSLILLVFISACTVNIDEKADKNHDADKIKVNTLLDSLNVYAATSNIDKYFNCYTEDAVFMGTDATERWTKSEFLEYARPWFEKGKGWSFTSVKRNIEFTSDGKTAWFDELLNTQMKICRGSGVLKKEKGEWKVSQYVLSMTIPNSLVDTVIQLKTAEEDSLLGMILLSSENPSSSK